MPSAPAFSPVFEPISPAKVKAILESKAALPADVIEQLASELGAGVWNLAWSVATVTESAVIETLRTSLTAIIDQGGTLRDWLDMLDEQGWRSPLGAWHEETIFRTTLGSAMEGERYDLLTGSQDVEYLVYSAIHDDRVRPEHLALDGRAWRRDEFPSDLWPPIDYNCRCSVIPADAGDLSGLGAKLDGGPIPEGTIAAGFAAPPSINGLAESVQQSIAERLGGRFPPPPRGTS